ncbi:hypothetical protein B566_EDAN014638 [Ephemera danica]|nr:hypothetical protein B566_EDAN014638 [Ephemera danica]
MIGDLDILKDLYSGYKHAYTLKVLVGCAPNGVGTFCSSAYPGSRSDKDVVDHCKVLSQMVTGDLILADKGFLIQSLLPVGVHLNIPPFLQTPQFSEAEVLEKERIARARIVWHMTLKTGESDFLWDGTSEAQTITGCRCLLDQL